MPEPPSQKSVAPPDRVPAHDAGRDRVAPARGRHDSPTAAAPTGAWMPRIASAVVAVCVVALVVVTVAAVLPSRAREVVPAAPESAAPVELEWTCPVEAPYRFEDSFLAPRSGDRQHKGTDVFADKGSPVSALVGGEVTKAVPTDDGTLGGARVWVAGDDGWWYYYAHLDSVAVEVGDRVETGERIGAVGNTGNARTTPAHVHVEMHFRAMTGPYVNPYAVLSDVCPQGE
ncbi:MAG: M23 family metallopeptidase [Acidimicrobiia bacterium]|nr:M23 family metallopeptidase [Acidimicrobiia bacterium]